MDQDRNSRVLYPDPHHRGRKHIAILIDALICRSRSPSSPPPNQSQQTFRRLRAPATPLGAGPLFARPRLLVRRRSARRPLPRRGRRHLRTSSAARPTTMQRRRSLEPRAPLRRTRKAGGRGEARRVPVKVWLPNPLMRTYGTRPQITLRRLRLAQARAPVHGRGSRSDLRLLDRQRTPRRTGSVWCADS